MDVSKTDIENYLNQVKASIVAGNYRFEMNERRQDNLRLCYEYVIDEEKRKSILLSLEPNDFSEILHNKNV